MGALDKFTPDAAYLVKILGAGKWLTGIGLRLFGEVKLQWVQESNLSTFPLRWDHDESEPLPVVES